MHAYPRLSHTYTVFNLEDDTRTVHVHHNFKLLRTSHDAVFEYSVAGRCNGPTVSHFDSVKVECCVRKA